MIHGVPEKIGLVNKMYNFDKKMQKTQCPELGEKVSGAMRIRELLTDEGP